VQASVQAGNTNFLTDAQTTYTAGRTSREDRGDYLQGTVQSAVRSGSPSDASAAATGAAGLYSTSGLTSSSGVRASAASEATQSAIRVRVAGI
jgi:hypothetical protein